jgi:hypothetical protein
MSAHTEGILRLAVAFGSKQRDSVAEEGLQCARRLSTKSDRPKIPEEIEG